jgi:hypothetical protein
MGGCHSSPWGTDAYPQFPPGVEDRNADVWEALLAVAEAAGHRWPERARKAAVILVTEAKSTPSLGIRLLTDIRTVFGDRAVMTTTEILKGPEGIEEATWGEIDRGKRLTAQGLSTRLAAYEIKPAQVRLYTDAPRSEGTSEPGSKTLGGGISPYSRRNPSHPSQLAKLPENTA